MKAYENSSLPVAERVKDLLSIMTLEEKVAQLIQIDVRVAEDYKHWIGKIGIGSIFNLLGEDLNEMHQLASKTRLGIPLICAVDAIHGNCFWTGATLFPTQLALSSSWNPDLLKQIARVTAIEAAATGAHWTFSPVFCIARDLRWGRINETFGEDPFIIGKLGKAMVLGYQGEDLTSDESIVACAKHFVGYSDTLGGRDASEASLSKRKLLSEFLPPFKEACKAGCRTFMVAYQAIDGVSASVNPWLLKDVLREEWGFEGVTVSDWDNIGHMIRNQMLFGEPKEPTIRAFNSGNDMMMVCVDSYESAIQAVQEGALEESVIDQACSRVLKLKFELGLFDGRKLKFDRNLAASRIGIPEHSSLAHEAACQSMVLLKNDNNFLPLDKNKIQKLALIGPNADDHISQLGDWSKNLCTLNRVLEPHPRENIRTVFDGLKKRLGDKVVYAKGCEVLPDREALKQNPAMEEASIAEAVELARSADVAVLVLGDNNALNGEMKDRATLDLTGRQMELFSRIKATGTPVAVVLINGKPLSIPDLVEGANAILEAWNPGMAGGEGVAEILLGERNPEGKLTISFPVCVGQQPVYYNQPHGWHGGFYSDIGSADPLYSFGYGLSYTEYSYSDLTIDKAILKPGEELTLSVTLKNTGKRSGTEIVQVYVRDLYSTVTISRKSLKEFRRVTLAAGEERRITFSLPFDAFSLVNEKLERIVEPGDFEVQVGRSSKEADLLKAGFRVE